MLFGVHQICEKFAEGNQSHVSRETKLSDMDLFRIVNMQLF